MNRPFIRYVVGFVVGVEGLFLLLTSLVGLIYKESEFLPYLILGILYSTIGYFNFKNKPKNNAFYAKEGFVMVALSWLVLSLLGAIPFVWTQEIPHYIDALFETVSGFTTTGSTIMNSVEGMSHVSLFWRLFTHWIGGMGILVFVLAILPMAGGYAINILKAESPGPSADRIVAKVSTSARYLYYIYGFITCVEMLCLFIAGLPLFDSITLSFATAGTGGFGLLNDSFVSYSSTVQIIVAIFMLLFGVNFSIYYGILFGRAKEMLKSEELRVYLSIVLIATGLIMINTYSYYSGVFETFKHSLFQVSSIITTTGFSSFDFELWPMFSKTILVGLMFCGAMAGSTGGGIKVSRIIILVKDALRNISTTVSPRKVEIVKFEDKKVDEKTVSSVKSFLAIYVLVFIVSILIVSLDGFSYTVNFTAVAATINNIGPGLEIIGPMGNFASFSVLSKIVLIFDMLAGRLELLPMIVLVKIGTDKLFKKKI